MQDQNKAPKVMEHAADTSKKEKKTEKHIFFLFAFFSFLLESCVHSLRENRNDDKWKVYFMDRKEDTDITSYIFKQGAVIF